MLTELMAGRPGQDAAPEAEIASLREASERWVGHHFDRDLISLIAELDGNLAATAGLIWFEHPPSLANRAGTEAYILNVYTRPDARPMGLARTLIERLVEHAKAAGVTRVWLRTSRQGRPLYESIGFRTQDDDMRLTEPEPASEPASEPEPEPGPP